MLSGSVTPGAGHIERRDAAHNTPGRAGQLAAAKGAIGFFGVRAEQHCSKAICSEIRNFNAFSMWKSAAKLHNTWIA